MVRKGRTQISDSVESSEPTLSVTAQQSRFHATATVNSASKEIAVKDLSISIGHREVLRHADFQLDPGKHYVLIGRNGIGKSTFLKTIAERLVPGIGPAVRILLLGQTQSNVDEGPNNVDLENKTVLRHVLSSNKNREQLMSEAARLSGATEDTDNPSAAIRAYREIVYERFQRDLIEARERATRMSGARGVKARKALTDLDEELLQAFQRLDSSKTNTGLAAEISTDIGDEQQKASELLFDIQSSLEQMDASAAETKVRSVLLGLGFSEDSLDKPVSRLSGGWRTRCNLACALCQPADLLLLDEPTSFLDLPSIIWLERYISTLDTTTVIVVTHDRAFADAIADELLVLRNMTLEHFRGNVSGYEVARMKKYKWLSRMKGAQEKQKQHMQETIDHNVRAAKRAGDDKKLKQAASRKKKLDDRMGMEVSSKGTRFKLNRDLAGWHNSRRDAIEVPEFDPPVRIAFPSDPSDLRFPGALLCFENVCFSYHKSNGKRPILQDINLTVHLGDRVGLVGLNGSGKSTLVSLAMGATDATVNNFAASPGSVSRHPRARIGLYSQQSVEDLDAIGRADPELTALTHLMKFAEAELTEQEARGLLSSLGLSGKVASDVPVLLLSGGQKVRLALAKLLWTPPHLLILDEVTTHLDSDTIQSLALAMRDYQGAVLVITHDRFFVRCVVEGDSPSTLAKTSEDTKEDETDSEDNNGVVKQGFVYRLSRSRLTILERGMQQYEESAAKASSKLGTA